MPEKESQTPPAGAPPDGAAPTTASEQDPAVADLTAELAAAKDRLLRSLAEQENIRSQVRRERDDAVRYAAAGFAGDLLSSLDNLERAIASVPEGQRAVPAVAGLLAGVEATRRALLDAFARHGLERFDPIGEPFDPHRHAASFEAIDLRYPPGTVTSVIEPGYMYRDRLLRPALVGVSKTSDAPDGTPPSKTAAP
jgi:molecular chaperone GrpE